MRQVIPALSMRAVHADHGGRPVLRGLDLTVRQGEVVALLGANGSGKSTAVRAAVGALPVTGGSIELFGQPLHRFRARHRLGYAPQRAAAAGPVAATVRETAAAGRLAHHRLRPFRRQDAEAVDAALTAVGLADKADEPVSALSGGQQQRVLTARALTGAPDLLVMDEPLAGVDLAQQRILADALASQARRGTALLLVLHELGPLAGLIDRTATLHGGVADCYGGRG